jgi:hypothetical protein
MKWFYLASFVAGMLTTALWSALIIFGIVTRHQIKGLALFAPLVFLVWGTREVFGYFQEERRAKIPEKSN